MALDIAQAFGAAGVGSNDISNAFAEGAPRASQIATQETAQAQTEADQASLPGQVGEGPLVVAVPMTRRCSTRWAANWPRPRRDTDDEMIRSGLDVNDAQVVGHERHKTAGHLRFPGAMNPLRWEALSRSPIRTTQSAEEAASSNRR